MTSKASKAKRSKSSVKPRTWAGDNLSLPPPVNPVDKIYTFQQVVDSGPITQDIVASVFASGATYFTLNSLDQAGTFTALFDQYKIDLVEYIMRPRANVSSAGNDPGRIYLVVDLDDASIPSLSDLRQYPSLVEAQGTACVAAKFKPRFAVSAYNGAFAAYANQTGWIDIASTTVQHYGIKFGLTGKTGGTATVYDIEYRLTISFRNVR